MNIIANVVSMIVGCILLLLLCGYDVKLPFLKGHSPEEEKKKIESTNKKIVNVLRVLKCVFLIIGITIMSRIEGFFKELGEANCSDDLTNFTFQHLGEEIPNVCCYMDLMVLCCFMDLMVFDGVCL